jgi:hypothetical protein
MSDSPYRIDLWLGSRDADFHAAALAAASLAAGHVRYFNVPRLEWSNDEELRHFLQSVLARTHLSGGADAVRRVDELAAHPVVEDWTLTNLVKHDVRELGINLVAPFLDDDDFARLPWDTPLPSMHDIAPLDLLSEESRLRRAEQELHDLVGAIWCGASDSGIQDDDLHAHIQFINDIEFDDLGNYAVIEDFAWMFPRALEFSVTDDDVVARTAYHSVLAGIRRGFDPLRVADFCVSHGDQLASFRSRVSELLSRYIGDFADMSVDRVQRVLATLDSDYEKLVEAIENTSIRSIAKERSPTIAGSYVAAAVSLSVAGAGSLLYLASFGGVSVGHIVGVALERVRRHRKVTRDPMYWRVFLDKSSGTGTANRESQPGRSLN